MNKTKAIQAKNIDNAPMVRFPVVQLLNKWETPIKPLES